MISKVIKLLQIGLVLLPFVGVAQQPDVVVSYGDNSIKMSDKFTIQLIIRDKEYNVSDFPNIDGFTKGGRSVAHTAFKEGTKRGLQHAVTQSYLPKAVGVYKLSPFSLKVNDKDIELDGQTIRVVSDANGNSLTKESTENEMLDLNIEVKEDALLALNISEEKVVVGEGFRVVVAFYVSDLNTAGWDFPKDLNTQVDKIAQTIKPINCLENRLEITNISAQRTIIKGKKFTEYKIFEAIYYPLNENAISFPAVQLSMLRLDTKKVGQEKRIFSSKPDAVVVNPLPEHPLKEKVAVGNFYLREWLNDAKVSTGNTFTYQFRIVGEGNFTTVNLPTPENDQRFDFYPPEIKSNVGEGRLSGERSFKFAIFPKDSGTIALKDYFQWVFFNTKKGSYDTLKSNVTVKIEGGKIKTSTQNDKDIYAGLENVDSSIVPINYRTIVKNITNVLVIGMIIGSLYMLKR